MTPDKKLESEIMRLKNKDNSKNVDKKNSKNLKERRRKERKEKKRIKMKRMITSYKLIGMAFMIAINTLELEVMKVDQFFTKIQNH